GPAKSAPIDFAPDNPHRFNNILYLIIFGGDHEPDSISLGESDKHEMLGRLVKSYCKELEAMEIGNLALDAEDPVKRETFEKLLLDCFITQSSSMSERMNKIQALFN